MTKKTDYVSAVEAARLTGLSERTIRRKLESGALKAEKRGPAYEIHIHDLKKLTRTGQQPALDALRQQIGELEEIVELQAGQLNDQAERIRMLEYRLHKLESHSAVARSRTGPFPQISSMAASLLSEQDAGQVSTPPVAAVPTSLPPGSMLAVHFADQIGVNRRTFNDQIRAGKVQATTINRGGRSEHWMTPEQQAHVKRERGL